MISAKVVLPNRLGFHMRPAGRFCSVALNYPCRINVIKGTHIANGKSVLGILATQIRYGDEFEIQCDGPQENDALETLVKLVMSGMGDDLEG